MHAPESNEQDAPPARGLSRTALGVAGMRAAHMLLDAPPRILEDPVALRLLGPEGERRIAAHRAEYQTAEMLGLRAHVVLRSRYAEDRLQVAVARGVKQFVVLGAGLDTFALRQPGWAEGLEILEIDAPATQAVKLRLIGDAALSVPSNVRFCAVDFEQESLSGGLGRHGVRVDRPSFFSWLGVSMYLREEAVRSVLRAIAAFPPGSEVVFTFARPPGEKPSPFDRRASAVGEPWLSYFTPEQLDSMLRSLGFAGVEFLSTESAHANYFAPRPQDLIVPRHVNIVSAMR